VYHRKVSEGSRGTSILLSALAYFERPAGEATIYPMAESTVFRNDDGSGAITTSFAYTRFGDTAQIERRTTTLPVVPTDQNGSGMADTITEIFDEEGNVIWQRDLRGFITLREYDLVTGAVERQIREWKARRSRCRRAGRRRRAGASTW
jgi:hypothetical protein